MVSQLEEGWATRLKAERIAEARRTAERHGFDFYIYYDPSGVRLGLMNGSDDRAANEAERQLWVALLEREVAANATIEPEDIPDGASILKVHAQMTLEQFRAFKRHVLRQLKPWPEKKPLVVMLDEGEDIRCAPAGDGPLLVDVSRSTHPEILDRFLSNLESATGRRAIAVPRGVIDPGRAGSRAHVKHVLREVLPAGACTPEQIEAALDVLDGGLPQSVVNPRELWDTQGGEPRSATEADRAMAREPTQSSGITVNHDGTISGHIALNGYGDGEIIEQAGLDWSHFVERGHLLSGGSRPRRLGEPVSCEAEPGAPGAHKLTFKLYDTPEAKTVMRKLGMMDKRQLGFSIEGRILERQGTALTKVQVTAAQIDWHGPPKAPTSQALAAQGGLSFPDEKAGGLSLAERSDDVDTLALILESLGRPLTREQIIDLEGRQPRDDRDSPTGPTLTPEQADKLDKV